MDTSGFFKNDSGMVVNGPNFVLSGSYSLYKEQKDTYTYPVEGWYWFDSEEEAYNYFGIPIPTPSVPPVPTPPYIPPPIP